jgi:hypothetical protein
MKKPKMQAMRHGGMKQAPPPMGQNAGAAGPSPAKSAGASGAVPLSAPKSLKAFGHKVPDFKSLTTDRGAFKIKG